MPRQPILAATLLLTFATLATGCATYQTPGAAVNLGDIDRADIAAEATAKESGLTNAWGSRSTIDRKRVAAEQAAFDLMLGEAAKTWAGIASTHGS